MNKLRKGFTIVELVIVIAVIAILAGVLIPTFSGVVSKANQSSALQKATSAMKSTLAMSETGTLNNGTIFALGTKDAVTYEFEYKNNQIQAVDKGEGYDPLTGVDRLIVKKASVNEGKLDNLTEAQVFMIQTLLGITISSCTAAKDGDTVKLTENDNTYTIYVNSDYPEDLVTFVPANQ